MEKPIVSTYLLGAPALAIGSPALILSLAGFAGRYWWVLDLASHFRVQYLAALSLLAVTLLLGRARRLAIVAAAVAALNGALIVPRYLGPTEPGPPGAPVLRAMLLSVHTANRDHDAVLRSVAVHAPDFIVFQEVDARWLAALGGLGDAYPHGIVRPRDDNFGIALFSRHPFAGAEIVAYGTAGVPSVQARFDLGGGAFQLTGTHPLPPISADYVRHRDRQLGDIAEQLRRAELPVLLLGDLNVSPWSYYFRRLLRVSGLRDGAKGWGLQPTWPAGSPALLIPIDHSLHSPEIRIVGRMVGDYVGSDHYPVIVDFVVSVPRA